MRAAVENTLAATSGPASSTRERAAELLDEVARQGAAAADELGRRGTDVREGLARSGRRTRGELERRGRGARDEIARRLALLEGRLAEIETRLREESKSQPKD